VNRHSWRIILCLSPAFWAVSTARAQGGPQVTTDNAVSTFPDAVRFELAAESDAPITSAILHYGADSRTCLPTAAQQAVDFDPAAAITVEWEWDFTRTGVLPPGVRFWRQWELVDANGAELLTEKQWDTIVDPRFEWQTVSRDEVTVSWTEGGQAFGTGLLDLSLESLNQLEQEMGVRPDGAVTLVVYPDSDQLTESFVTLPEWTGGVALSEFNVMVTGIRPGQDEWAASVVPHELTHLVVGSLVFNCRGVSLPTWLNEGLAVNAEGPGTPEEAERVRQALHAGQLPSLRSMANGFQADTGRAVLAYAHSAEVVRFMIREYGGEKIGELLALVRLGETIDPALDAVYGLDTDGLDAAWRMSEGAAPLPTAVPTAAQADRTPVPTLALWTAAPLTMVAATGSPATGAPSTPTPAAVAQAATATPPAEFTPPPARESDASLSLPWLAGGLLCACLLVVVVSGGLALVLRRGRRT
jgi:hypothetical protein